ncbi:MAG: hypothetical protein CMO74_00990 [Verrucomicrobiales bacterium]|nr:hypothetical protein [Verrucomicrobiales bacterium]
MVAAFDDWGILIFLIVAILSNFFGKKEEDEELEVLPEGGAHEFPCDQCGRSFQTPEALHQHQKAKHSHAPVPAGQRQQVTSLEAELQRLLSGSAAPSHEIPPPLEEPKPPVVTPPPVLKPKKPKREPKPEPAAGPLHKAREAFESASQIHEKVAEKLRQSHEHVEMPVEGKNSSAELRKVVEMIRQPATARQAFAASVILGSPKGLE